MYNSVGIPIVFRKSRYDTYGTFETAMEIMNDIWNKNYDYYLEPLSDEAMAAIDAISLLEKDSVKTLKHK